MQVSTDKENSIPIRPPPLARSLAQQFNAIKIPTPLPALSCLPACLPLVRQENLLLVLGLLCEL